MRSLSLGAYLLIASYALMIWCMVGPADFLFGHGRIPIIVSIALWTALAVGAAITLRRRKWLALIQLPVIAFAIYAVVDQLAQCPDDVGFCFV